jgi:DNA-binding MarR family transcriptional regulator
MTKLENRLLRAIGAAPGIGWQQLSVSLNKRKSALKKALISLELLGYIGFRKSGYYSRYRALSVYKKGVDEYVRAQRKAGIELSNEDMEVEEIKLENYLTPKQLSKYISCVAGDDYYWWNYGINASNAVLFEKTNGVCFDFEQFEYILTYWME